MKTRNFYLIIAMSLSVVFLYSCKEQKTAESSEIKQYSIEEFYKNIQNYGGAFSTDEKKLLISSNKSGIYNVYEINLSDTTLKEITSSTVESIFAIDYVPGTNKILYSSDKGGNEINHIYLKDEDGKVKDLTPGEKEKVDFFGWSIDKKAFYYGSNKRDSKFFDLYKMTINDWNSKMIYKNEKGLDLQAISWNDKYVVLNENITTSENKLFLYDLASKKSIEISERASPGNYSFSGFTKDNKSMNYITNAGKEFQYLVKYDIESKKKEILYETKWDVMYAYYSENEKYRVVAINEDGKNKIIVFDNKTNQEVNIPSIPDGAIISVSISDSEKLMRLTVGSSKSTSDLYLYNFETKELKKLTNTINPAINPNDLVSAEVIRYKSFDSIEIPAIYYKPLKASPENKVPALIWVHGGPGGQSKLGYFALIQYLVNHGYAILAVNNRGSSGYGKTFFMMDDRNHGEKDLMDCIYGKKYLQTLDYIDKDNIGIIGGSYGGYMTMAAMTLQPDEFKVGVDIFGVTNWLRTLKNIPPYWESFRKALYSEMGDPTTADSVRLRNISPLFSADKIKNPVIVLQGTNDPRVLKVESDEIVAAMKKNNIPVEYVIFEDEGHGFVKKENEIKGYGAILTFLDKHLKNEKK